MRERRPSLALLLSMALLACESGARERADAVEAAQPRPIPADRPFVVFSKTHVVLDRLEIPTPPPVSVGSRPGPDTLLSDDPTLVGIAPDGQLVAHRNGRTAIRTLHGEGSLLVVEVAEVNGIRLKPDRMELRPGQGTAIRVLAADGSVLPPHAVQWGTTSPRRALVLGDKVIAGSEAGTAKVVARYGSQVAEAEVVVRSRSPKGMVVVPASARLRPGAVQNFQASGRSGPVPVRWRSSNAGVVAPMQGGLFLARAAGVAEVCAVTADSTKCATVEVSK